MHSVIRFRHLNPCCMFSHFHNSVYSVKMYYSSSTYFSIIFWEYSGIWIMSVGISPCLQAPVHIIMATMEDLSMLSLALRTGFTAYGFFVLLSGSRNSFPKLFPQKGQFMSGLLFLHYFAKGQWLANTKINVRPSTLAVCHSSSSSSS